ncbi:MAG: hypothetical protein QF664_06630 [Dehalococcoidia bacterium]|jgi:hypothetical protein|nr:hypothetical protein [Dehalococcoidia bacterium]
MDIQNIAVVAAIAIAILGWLRAEGLSARAGDTAADALAESQSLAETVEEALSGAQDALAGSKFAAAAASRAADVAEGANETANRALETADQALALGQGAAEAAEQQRLEALKADVRPLQWRRAAADADGAVAPELQGLQLENFGAGIARNVVTDLLRTPTGQIGRSSAIAEMASTGEATVRAWPGRAPSDDTCPDFDPGEEVGVRVFWDDENGDAGESGWQVISHDGQLQLSGHKPALPPPSARRPG